MTGDDDLMRLLDVHRQLDELAGTIAEILPAMTRLSWYGTDELPAALNLVADCHRDGGAVDAFIDACRWVSRAYTRTPLDVRGGPDGANGLALNGAIIALRANLAELDAAQ
jgi:hypothetical protein